MFSRNKTFSGFSQHSLNRRLLSSTAIAAIGVFAFVPGAAVAKDVGQHDVWEFGDFKDGAEGTVTGRDTGYVQYSGDRIIGDLIQEDIGEQGHVDLNARLTVARGVESGAMHILGKLTSTGEVFVLDVNGFVFGANSIVDTAGFAAIGGNIADEDILDGDGVFDIDVADNARIEIREGAQISVAEAGLAAFVAPTVTNSGIIKARLGKIAFASGEKVTLDLYGDRLVEIEVPSEQADALLENKGRLEAEGGEIYMTAAAAKEAVDNIINVEGVTTVASATQKGGKIVLSGSDKGKVEVSGQLIASGETGGGDIAVTGQNVDITDTGVIANDAGNEGDGGTTYIYGDDYAIFRGTLLGRGGSDSGDGGFAEVSAGTSVGYYGYTDLGAENGENGTLLIDPEHLTISDASFAADWDAILSLGELGKININDQALADTLHNNNVNLWATKTISTGSDIDISEYDYKVIDTNGSWWPGNWTIDEFNGITKNDLNIAAPEVNLIHDITLGLGELNAVDLGPDDSVLGFDIVNPPFDIEVETLNLDGKVYKRGSLGDPSFTTLAEDAQINTMAGTVNVLSPDALIQQGVHFAESGATVEVSAGEYNESVLVDKTGLTLKGANSGVAGYDTRGTETKVTGNSPAFTIVNDDVTLDGFLMDGAGLTYGVLLDDVKGTEVINNVVKNAQNAAVGGVIDHDDTIGTLLVSGNSFEGSNANGITLEGDGAGAPGNGNALLGVRVDITDNQIGAGGDAVAGQGISFSKTGDLAGNADAHWGWDVVTSSEINISGNEIHSDGEGIAFDRVAEAKVSISGGSINSLDDGIYFRRGLHSGADVDITKASVNAGDEAIDVQGALRTGAVFEVDGGAYTGGRNGIEFSAIAGDATIKNATISGNGSDKRGVNLLGRISGNLSIDDNKITGRDDAIGSNNKSKHAIDGGTVSISGNTLEGVNGDGIELADVINGGTVDIIDNAKIKGGDNGIHFAGDLDDSDINIFKNDHIKAGNNGILISGEATNGTVIDIDKNRVRLATNGAGISVSDTTAGGLDLDITRNSVWKTGTDGIYVENTPDVEIDNNNIGYYGSGLTPVYTWDGSPVIGDEGIDVNNSAGAQVTNNNVTNTTSNGVSLNPSPGAHIANNVIINVGANGIHVQDSAKVRVYSNTIDGALKGVAADNSTDIWIYTNIIDNASLAGVHLTNTDGTNYVNDADIWNNTINNVAGATGILVENSAFATVGALGTNQPAPDGLAIGNVVTGGGDGIVVLNSDNSATRYNTVSGSDGDGIRHENTNGARIENNVVSNTTSPANTFGSGIQVLSSDDVNIEGNETNNTDWDGIRVVGGDNVTISENEVTDAQRAGIYGDNLSNSEISGNTVDTTQQFRGIALWNSDDVDVTKNTVFSTNMDGIIAGNVSDLVISENVVYDTGEDGIQVSDSAGAEISDNYIGYSDTKGTVAGADNIGAEGIDVNNSAGAQITGNFVTQTVSNGISVNPSDNVVISFNDILRAGAHGILAEGHEYGIWARNLDVLNNVVTLAEIDSLHVHYYEGIINVLGNTFHQSGDDGAELHDLRGEINVSENIITESGYGVNEDDEGSYYGGYDEFGAGNDALHIRNVSGDEDVNGYVNVDNNYMSIMRDDGIEIANVRGFADVILNTVLNAGYGDEAPEEPEEPSYYGSPNDDGFGADAIHVRRVIAYKLVEPDVPEEDSEYNDYEGPQEKSLSGFSKSIGIAQYPMVVIDNEAVPVNISGNTVNTSADDGIQGLSNGNTTILNNTISKSGLAEGSDFEFGLDIWGGDGIHVLAGLDIGAFQPDYGEPEEYPADTALSGFYPANGAYLVPGPEAPYAGFLKTTVEISGNTVSQSGDDGGHAEGVTTLQISDNSISTSGDNGWEILGYAGTEFFATSGSESGIPLPSANFAVLPLDQEQYTFVVDIDTDTISASGTDGIVITGYDDVTITDTNVSTSGDDGVQINRFPFIITELDKTRTTFEGNTISDSSNRGLYLSGDGHGLATVRDNSFTGFSTGFRAESGSIDISDLVLPNSFTNTNPNATPVGIQMDGAPDRLSIVNETLGATEFTGFTNPGSFYVRFEDGSILDPVTNDPILINGLDATFDDFTPPADGILTQAQLDFLEDRLYDADDAIINGRGQIFVGFVPAPGLDNIEDFFNQFGAFAPGSAAANVTILGLPAIEPGAFELAGIEPFAGEEPTPEELAGVEPAAGEDEGEDVDPEDIEPAAGDQDANCWGEALNAANGGTSVSYSFGGDFEDSITQAANCGTESF